MTTCLDAALEYLELDFSVIPVGRDKKPLIRWQEFQSRPPSRDEVCAWWERWPEANVGLVTGTVSGLVVVDADSVNGQIWIQNHLPVTGAYALTKKGVHAYFRHPGREVKNAVRIAPDVDIRADGGYVVAPPSVHESGFVYEWRFPEGFDGLSDLAPCPNLEQFQARVEKQFQAGPDGRVILNLDVSNEIPWDGSDYFDLDGVPEGGRNDALARLAGKLAAKGLEYGDVLKVALGWNQANNPPLGQDEVERTVRSICDIHSRNHPGDNAPIETAIVPAQSPATEDIPPELLYPGGWLDWFIWWTGQSTTASHPLFNLGAAICALGSLAGQKVMTETGLRTNFYVFALADSGTGKDAPLSALSKLFHETGCHDLLGPNHVTSSAAIFQCLSGHETRIMMLDEMGDLMAGLKAPNSPQADIPRVLKSLFSSTDRSEVKQYADSKNNLVLAWHHLSLYATGAPGRFWDSLTFGDVTDGFLARVLVLERDIEAPRPKRPAMMTPPAELVEFVKSMNEWKPQFEGDTHYRRPVPRPVFKTREAEGYFEAWADKWFDLRNQYRKDETGRPAIYGRAAEHAHKLALIRALSRCGPGVVHDQVNLDDVRWACGLVDWIIPRMVDQIGRNISVNEFDKLEKRIRDLIARRATRERPGLTRRELMQSIRGLTKRNFDEVIDRLQTTGEIGKSFFKPQTGPQVELFFLAGGR